MHEIFSLIAYFYAKLGNSGKVSQPICLLGYAHASTSLKNALILMIFCPNQYSFLQQRRRAALNTITDFADGETTKRAPTQVPFQDEDNLGKKTLILDLDETLITSSCLEFPSADLKIKVHLQNGSEKSIWVKFRPGAQSFLKEMSEYYELIIFTASVREYANVVLDFLDTQYNASVRLFRENCTQEPGKGLYKDIRKLHRNMESLIIIDNQESQFRKSPENGIKISDFKIDRKDDQELEKLMPFLRFMSGVKDVRPVSHYMRSYFEGEEIHYMDVNNMENVFQRGKIVEEDRLTTEKTESKIEQVDMGLFKDDSSQSGNTIKLESRDYIKGKDNQMMRHFEDDIDTAIQIQKDINNVSKSYQSRHQRNSNMSNQGSGDYQGQFSARANTPIKKPKNSLSEQQFESNNQMKQDTPSRQEQVDSLPKKIEKKQKHKGTKSAFDFSTFKTSIYNKILPTKQEQEKENLKNEVNVDKTEIVSVCSSPSNADSTLNMQNSLHQNSYTNDQNNYEIHSPLEEQILHKSLLDTNQTQNADNSENFISKPATYKKAPIQRRCLTQGIHFAEVSLKDENFHSPCNFKEI